jgi:uracil-DNA glycosylase
MTPRPALSPVVAARALADWWELAGLEPYDVDAEIKRLGAVAGASAAQSPAVNAPAKLTVTRAQPASARKPNDALAEAIALANACTSIDALHKAVTAFDGCTLKPHALNTLFADGAQGAPVMIIGEAPDRSDDASGTCFSGAPGQLLDKMLASIGLDRARNCYLTPFIPWRPPGDRKPTAEEVAICLPFVKRHIALAAPKAILFVGSTPAQALLETSDSVMKLRTKPLSYANIYAQCMLSPAYLINRSSEKALAWKDLLRFQEEISVRGVALKG